MSIMPGQVKSYTVTLEPQLAPPSVSASSSQCEQISIVITDNSTQEDRFQLYRDKDGNFNGNETVINLNIPTPSKPGTGPLSAIIDLVAPNQAYYYHARAQRDSPVAYSGPGTSNQVTAVECPPEIDASISITGVTSSDGSFVAYTPGVKIKNGDTLDIQIVLYNRKTATATNVTNTVTLSNNLSVVQGSPNVNLGSISGQTTKIIDFKVKITSAELASNFDRISINGSASYQYKGSPALSSPARYTLGPQLIYLKTSPVQFHEEAPQ